MKKALSLILSLVMCLSLCACGGGDATPPSDSPQQSTTLPMVSDPVIEETEPSTLDHTEPTDLLPEDTETPNQTPKETIVELTIENWDTYFELKEEYFFSENAFGEAETLHIYHYYFLKEEYGKVNKEKSSIAIEFSWTYAERECIVDYANRTFTLGDYKENKNALSDTVNMFTYCGREERYGVNIGWDAGGCYKGSNSIRYCTDFQIIRVKGTLCLVEE